MKAAALLAAVAVLLFKTLKRLGLRRRRRVPQPQPPQQVRSLGEVVAKCESTWLLEDLKV